MNLLTYLLGQWAQRLDPTWLLPLQNRVISLAPDGLPPLYLHGVSGSLTLSRTPPRPPDLHLNGTLTGLLHLARTGQPNPQVHLQGDMELAQALRQLLAQAPLLLEEQLAQVGGDPLAGMASGLIRQAWADCQAARTAGQQSLSDYLIHEARLIPGASELAAFHQAVDVLRDDVARLSLRIQRLQTHRTA